LTVLMFFLLALKQDHSRLLQARNDTHNSQARQAGKG